MNEFIWLMWPCNYLPKSLYLPNRGTGRMNCAILKRESVLPGQEGNAMAAVAARAGGLAGWAERSALRRAGSLIAGGPVPGRLRFVFYGRVSTEDWQDPVTSRARQREQAEALVLGHGVIVDEFFDAGESRTVAWARRPQAAALVAQLTDSGRGWDAIVIDPDAGPRDLPLG
jgi:hypothetical protein